MAMEVLAEHACFGGVQGFYRHESATIGLPMRFGVYTPPQALAGPVPVLTFLAGLTCNEETFAIKAGAQRVAAELGLILVTPDTSPRNTGVEGADAAWDFGTAAGFYLDATQTPWAAHWRMESWLMNELPAVLAARFHVHAGAQGLFGHSMGGHGALTLALRHPGRYRSVSAFAPIVAPCQVPWGQKALGAYLGEDPAAWRAWDATALVASGLSEQLPLLVDQGEADEFLATQLRPELLAAACQATGHPLTLRRQPGHDHSYYFIATFLGDHFEHHAKYLWA
jgi:S-formylglutathione hydrolase